jgi:A-factor type gamma-butyrolactone 1'-reductase (1S-forming)
MVSVVRNLEEKIVIVTGATSGIGRAAALRFAAAGANVVAAGRRRTQGLALVEEISSKGGHATFIQTDVSVASSVAALVAGTMERFGRIDCAFNNAGIPGANLTATADQSEASWDEVMNTNLRGLWLCMKHELREMKARRAGVIVNTGSIYSFVGSELGIAPYIASKHAVLGLTRAAAIEYARDGIRINAICPGMTLTEMTAPALQAVPGQFNAHIDQNVPLRRLAEPDEIAAAVVWLCSPDAGFVTGQSLSVDGGWLSR